MGDRALKSVYLENFNSCIRGFFQMYLLCSCFCQLIASIKDRVFLICSRINPISMSTSADIRVNSLRNSFFLQNNISGHCDRCDHVNTLNNVYFFEELIQCIVGSDAGIIDNPMGL